jgi:putative sterol carrier protein
MPESERVVQTLRIAALAGINGRLRLDIGDTPGFVLEIHDTNVVTTRGDAEADAVAMCDSETTVAALRAGELNPVVAALQGRLSLSGDRAFALKVMLALRTITPAAARAAQRPG